MAKAKVFIKNHPQRKEIIKAIVNQEPYSQIAKKYDVSASAVKNFVKDYLAPSVAKEQAKQGREGTKVYLDQIDEITCKCRKLFAACDEWLQDPDDPSKYTLDPRAEELDVVYLEEDDNGRKVRKTDTLDRLLNRVERYLDADVVKVTTKHADPRKLILDTAETMARLLELTARITGDIKEIQGRADLEHVVVPQIVQAIMISTAELPEVQRSLVEGLRRIVDGYHRGIDSQEA